MNKNTPPEKNTQWSTSFQSTESGAGKQFLLLDCRARACAKAAFCSQTPVPLARITRIRLEMFQGLHHTSPNEIFKGPKPRSPTSRDGTGAGGWGLVLDRVREMGGAPRNNSWAWMVKPSGCHCTDASGGKTYRRVPTPLRSTFPSSDRDSRLFWHELRASREVRQRCFQHHSAADVFHGLYVYLCLVV